MKKRLLASILSLAMVFSLVPVSALAEDEEPGGDPAPVCTCEARCTEGAVDETCPVCAEDDTLCAFEETPADEGKPTPCTVTVGCTLEAGHEGECVFPDEPEEPTAEEQLAALIAALPAPDEIDPEDEEQVEEVNGQLSEIYAFAGENDLDIEDNEIINAVIAALYSAELLATEENEAAIEFSDASSPYAGEYLISTKESLDALSKAVNGGNTMQGIKFYLQKDIILNDGHFSAKEGSLYYTPDQSDTDYSVNIENATYGDSGQLTAFVPIGFQAKTSDAQWEKNGFAGEFYGNNHEIKGLFVNGNDTTAAAHYKGLFGALLTGGKISDLAVSGCVYGAGSNSGGIVGKSWGCIDNCHFSGVVMGAYNAGGIVGETASTGAANTLQNCTNTAHISDGSTATNGGNWGGIAGCANGVSIQNCINYGAVACSKYTNVGGIIGVGNAGISSCINWGSITGPENSATTGGIVGSHNTGTTEQNFICITTADELEKYTKITRPNHAKCAVALYLNGGSFDRDIVVSSGALATPTKENQIFDGWYVNSDLSGASASTLETEKIYYAKWITPVTITITEADMNQASANETSAIAAAISRLNITDPSSITELKVTTEDGVYLGYNDFQYMSTDLTNLKKLDISAVRCVNDNPKDKDLEGFPEYDVLPRGIFYADKHLHEIVLPESITKIARMAFNNCELRGDLVIPDSVIEIRNGAFGDYIQKSHISSLTLSKNLKSLGSANFLGYQIDGNLEFPATLQAIGNAAFTKAFVSGTVIIPEDSQLSTIGGATFEGFFVKGFGTISYHQERDITQFYNLFRHMDVSDLRNSGITVFDEFKGNSNDYCYKRAANRPGIFDVRGCDLSTFSIGGANNLTLICDHIPDSGISMKAAYTSLNENIARVTKTGASKDPGTIVLGDQFGTATLKTINIDTTNGSYREIRIIHMPSTLKMQYGDTLNIDELFQPMGYDVSWSSSDPTVISVSNGIIDATRVGTAVLTATVTPTAGMKHAGSSATLTMDVEVTPLPITFGTNVGENPNGSITYVRDSIAPEFSQFAKFYPAQVENGSVSVVADSSPITLTQGTDITFEYDAGGGKAAYNYLPLYVTGNEGLEVTVRLINDNYRFVTSSNSTPSDTITEMVVVTAENKTETEITGLPNVDSNSSYEYTGVGIAPVTDLTGIGAEGIDSFTVHFHRWDDTVFPPRHLENKPASELTQAAIQAIAPKEPGSYLMILDGVSDSKYGHQSWIFTIEKGTPKGEPTFEKVSSGVTLSTVTLSGSMKNAAGAAVAGSFAWENGDQTVERGKSYAWTFTPNDTEHYNTVNGETVLLRASSGGGGGSSSSSSAVSVDSGKNGSVTVSPKSAKKGDTVTVTVKPDKGYEVDEIIVTDKNGDEVKLTKKSDTQYTFTMPSGKVTVEASFAKIEDAPDEGLAFVDVPANAYYADAVAWAVENGITSGTSDTTFSPNAACTRAQMVTFLWRAAGSPKAAGNSPFTDLDVSAYYYDAVLWAVSEGITSGTSATTFGPNDTVTRGQTVTFLYRASGSPTSSGNSFADVAHDAYYANAVAWAVSEGITSGTTATTFGPDQACTRAQIVTFLYRAKA